jgi:hypothetical protein
VQRLRKDTTNRGAGPIDSQNRSECGGNVDRCDHTVVGTGDEGGAEEFKRNMAVDCGLPGCGERRKAALDQDARSKAACKEHHRARARAPQIGDSLTAAPNQMGCRDPSDLFFVYPDEASHRPRGHLRDEDNEGKAGTEVVKAR